MSTDQHLRAFAERVDAVRHLVEQRYVRPDWAARNQDLERDLLPVPPPDFLRHPAIRFQMFVDERVLPHELPFVRGRLNDDHLLAEDQVIYPRGDSTPMPRGWYWP
jgi:hypothetical protein